VVPELKEDFFHVKGGGEGLDEDGGTDGVVSHVNVRLGEEEDIVPETGLEIVFHFGEVKVGAGAALDEFMGIVEKVEGKVKEGARDGTVIDGDAGLIKMPASGAVIEGETGIISASGSAPNDKHCGIRGELVGFPTLLKVDLTSDSVVQI
jgi:hypothetical protein